MWLAAAVAAHAQGGGVSEPAPAASTASAPVAASAAASTVAATADPSPEEAHRALRELKSRMEKALADMDIDTLLANVTEDVVFTTMNGDVAHGRAGIRNYFETMMKGPNKIVSRIDAHFEADEISRLYGNDLAIAYGSSKDHYTMANGGDFDVKGRWTASMVRRDGKWLVANFHYSSNMFDNAVLDMQRKWFTLGAAVLAAVLAALGWFLGRAQGRKRRP